MPAAETEVVGLEKRAGKGARNNGSDGGAAEKDGDRLASFGRGQPAGEIINDPGKEACLGRTEEKTQNIKPGLTRYERHQRGNDAPGKSNARQPETGSELLEEEVRGHLQDRITEKEKTRPEAVGRAADTEIRLSNPRQQDKSNLA